MSRIEFGICRPEQLCAQITAERASLVQAIQITDARPPQSQAGIEHQGHLQVRDDSIRSQDRQPVSDGNGMDRLHDLETNQPLFCVNNRLEWMTTGGQVVPGRDHRAHAAHF